MVECGACGDEPFDVSVTDGGCEIMDGLLCAGVGVIVVVFFVTDVFKMVGDRELYVVFVGEYFVFVTGGVFNLFF